MGGRIGRFVLKWSFIATVWMTVAVAVVLAYFAYDLPSIDEVEALQRRPAVTVLAADGSQIARYGDLSGVTVSVADLPQHLVNAVVAIEDRRFYSHFGVDPIGLIRAAWVNYQAGGVVQGGSTITQQLAKNLFLTHERTMKRKVQEFMLAVWLERNFTKDQILTAYLNRVYLGAGTYGVDAAARTYFDRPAREVNLNEAAILAGLLRAPSRYAPSHNPDGAQTRANVVLAAMEGAGFITNQQHLAARQGEPVMPRGRGSGDGMRYFADWIVDQVPGFVGEVSQDLIVVTTLDPNRQRVAMRHVADITAAEGVARGASEAAAVVIDPEGAVRALVGGRDYRASQFNRATQSRRQPGSAFKPLVFLAGLEAGLRPASNIQDAPITVGNWSPGNFNDRYEGSVTLTRALAQSLNTAAVRVLDHAGVDRTRQVARRLGITAPLVRDMSLALGTSEVSLLELTGAYVPFANGGLGTLPHGVVEIRDHGGRVLYQRQQTSPPRVVQDAPLADMNAMLTQTLTSGTGRNAVLDRPAAGKTGTSQRYRDAWFIGYTADMVTGVWMGNDDNRPMDEVTGGTLPAELWRRIMTDAHDGRPVQPLPGSRPRGPASQPVDQAADSGDGRVIVNGSADQGPGLPAANDNGSDDGESNPFTDAARSQMEGLLDRVTGGGG